MGGLKPEISFTPTVESEFGKENVIVVKDAMGGQPILRWYKEWKSETGEAPEETGDLYDRLMGKVNAAIQGQKIATITFVWMQGEADSRKERYGVYEKSLKGLLDQLGEDMGRSDINFVIGRLSDAKIHREEWVSVRKAQVNVAEESEQGAWVDTDDLNSGVDKKGNTVKDVVHYTPEGYRTLGKRFADKSIELIERNVTPK